MYELTCTFTEFYDSCYCINKAADGVRARLASPQRITCRQTVTINHSRVLLCKATAIVLEQSFALLGLPCVDKM